MGRPSTIDHRIFDRWPNYQATLIAVDHADSQALAPVAAKLLAKAHEFARSLNVAAPGEHVLAWRQACLDFGLKLRIARPSAESLIRRAASERGCRRSTCWWMCTTPYRYCIRCPSAVRTWTATTARRVCASPTGGEQFYPVANGEAVIDRPEPGEPIWLDGGGVTCRRWNWRQTNRTAIDYATRRVGFIVDSLGTEGHERADEATNALCRLFGTLLVRVIVWPEATTESETQLNLDLPC